MSSVPPRRMAAVAAAMVAAGVVVLGQYRPVDQSALAGWAVALVAAAATGGVAFAAVERPWWGVLGWVGAMPLINLARAQLWIGPIQVIASTPLALALAAGIIGAWRSERVPTGAPVSRAVIWMIGALPVLAVAATVAAPLSDESLNVTLHGLIEPVTMLAVVVALRPGPRQGLWLLVALVCSVTLASLINLGWMQATLSDLDLYQRRLLFARLTFWNVGLFGEMLVLALPALGAIILLRREIGWPRAAGLAAWGALVVSLVALFYTYTKSAWLSGALVSGLMVVLVRGWRRRAALLVATLLLLAVVVPYPSAILSPLAPGLNQRYRDVIVAMQSEQRVDSWDPETTEGSGSVEIRWIALGASAQLVAGHPLFGVGPARFGPEFAVIRPNASVPNLSSAHNLLPNLAAEYGLPLALIVIALLGLGIAGGVAALRAGDATARVVRASLAIMLIGFVAMGTLFGNDLYRTYRTVNSDLIMLGVLLGLALALRATGPSAGRAAGYSRPSS